MTVSAASTPARLATVATTVAALPTSVWINTYALTLIRPSPLLGFGTNLSPGLRATTRAPRCRLLLGLRQALAQRVELVAEALWHPIAELRVELRDQGNLAGPLLRIDPEQLGEVVRRD